MATISSMTYAILFIQWVILLLVLVGVYFAVKKNFSTHQNIMTFSAIIQILLIVLMIIKFFSGVTYPAIIYVHVALGSIIALVILYTLLVMNKKLPNSLNISESRQKLLMRVTAIFWIIMIVAGTTVFYVIYFATSSSTPRVY